MRAGVFTQPGSFLDASFTLAECRFSAQKQSSAYEHCHARGPSQCSTICTLLSAHLTNGVRDNEGMIEGQFLVLPVNNPIGGGSIITSVWATS